MKIEFNLEQYEEKNKEQMNRMIGLFNYQKDLFKKMNFNYDKYEFNKKIHNAYLTAIPLSLINLITDPMYQSAFKKEVKGKEEKYLLLSFYMRMLTSHIMIIEDFEYFNVALILKYMLEAVAGILENKNNLKEHFKELNYLEYQERKQAYNEKIYTLIKMNLGNGFGKIYKEVNGFAHPHIGPMYGVNLGVQNERDSEVIAWLTKTYEVCSIKVFELVGIELNIDFMGTVYKTHHKIIKEELERLFPEK